MMITFIVIVLSIFIIHWQLWPQTITTVDATSGRLLGTQADGGGGAYFFFLV